MKLIQLREGATPDDIRRALERVNLRKCVDEDGLFYSPITGQRFNSYFALSGHIGAKLRSVERSELTEDRAGYIKAIRRGIEPTETQREAHRKYMRELRRRGRET